jgi:hypothetical protein
MPWPLRSSRLPFLHVTRLRLAALLLAGLTLAACGSEPVPEQLAAPAELPSPSVSASPTAGGEVPAEPSQPPEQLAPTPIAETPAAPEADAAAADAAEVEQFVRDYYAAINRAQYEGDLAGLEAFSLPGCNCRGTAKAVERMLELGTVEGAAWQLRSIEVQSVHDNVASVSAVVDVADGRVLAPDGEVAAIIDNADTKHYTHAVLRSGNNWVMGQIVS